MAVYDHNYAQLHATLFDDVAALCPEYSLLERDRDKETVAQRFLAEGFSFFTRTLPALGKHFDNALETGTFVPFPGFRREKGRTTPCFLRGLFKEVFDEEGRLCVRNAEAIRYLRQLLYFQYKLEMEYDQHVVDEVIQNFIAVDQGLPNTGDLDSTHQRIQRVARHFIGVVFSGLEPRDIIPRPGPGASADGTPSVERFEPKTHYNVIHQIYPYYDYFYCRSGFDGGRFEHLCERAAAYRALPRVEAGVSLMRAVPKDSRGPRIICMEPQEYMFLQQGLGDAIREHLERHPLTCGRVNFHTQVVNQDLAHASSIDRGYATLDMKDASDRISRDLVHELFSDVPKLRDALIALSTPRTLLPDGTTIESRKFAPMGSSLCFPIMSIVHYALGLAAIRLRTSLSFKALAKDSLYVYGDDLIVRTPYASHLFEAFPHFGLMFNRGKSFVDGFFRESCGKDVYMGVDVTPQRLKQRFLDRTSGQRRPEVDKFVAARDMAYNLRIAGYEHTSSLIRLLFSTAKGVGINFSFPTVVKDSTCAGWFVDDPDLVELPPVAPVWQRRYQRHTYAVRTIAEAQGASMIGCWERLLRTLVLRMEDSSRSSNRFTRRFFRVRRMPVQSFFGPVKPGFDCVGM